MKILLTAQNSQAQALPPDPAGSKDSSSSEKEMLALTQDRVTEILQEKLHKPLRTEISWSGTVNHTA